MAGGFPLKRLMAQPVFRRWAVANLLARLPLTMNLLVLVLAGEAVTGSVSTGAILAGAATFSAGASARWRGRRLDRVELNHGLRGDMALSAFLVAVLAVAVLIQAPVALLFGLAVVMGWAYAAVLGAFRALLVESVEPDDLEAANALDAVFVEVAFVAGPALAALLATVLAPGVVMLLMAGAFSVAVFATAGLPRREPRDEGDPAGPAPFLTRGATPIYLIAVVVGLIMGSLEALTPARIESLGMEPGESGTFLALLAAGSAVAGVVAANFANQLRRGRLYAAGLLVVLALALWPVSATSSALLLGMVMFAAGMPLAPMNALGSFALQRIVATERRAEGFSTYTAAILIGAGSGQLLAGVALETWSAGTLVGVGSVLSAGLAVLLITAALRRRIVGLPPGIGSDHDPSVPHPDSYRLATIADQTPGTVPP